MSTEPKADNVGQTIDSHHEPSPMATGWVGTIEGRYRKMKEHAETYPYVWGSYILVYGGFGLWLTYRWRRLRSTEDRVRALQERLRKVVEIEQSANSASLTNKPSPSTENKATN